MENLFTEIKLDALKEFVSKWASERESFIQKITLYPSAETRTKINKKFCLDICLSDLSKVMPGIDKTLPLKDIVNASGLSKESWDIYHRTESELHPKELILDFNKRLVLYINPAKKLSDFSEENTTERDRTREERTWKLLIKPIIEKYSLYYGGGDLYTYTYSSEPEKMNWADLLWMQRKLIFFAGEYNLGHSFLNVIKGLKQTEYSSSGNPPDSIKELLKAFDRLLEKIMQAGELPFFLDVLYQEAKKFELGNKREQTDKEKPKEKLNRLLAAIHPEIKKLYEGIKTEMCVKKKDLFDATKEDALNVYAKDKYEYILEEDIKKSGEGFETGKPARDIKGRIMFNFIKREMPEEIANNKISPSYQKLYQYYLKFKKNTEGTTEGTMRGL